MQTYEETVRDAFVFLFPHLIKAVAAGAKWWYPEIMRWSSYKATSSYVKLHNNDRHGGNK